MSYQLSPAEIAEIQNMPRDRMAVLPALMRKMESHPLAVGRIPGRFAAIADVAEAALRI